MLPQQLAALALAATVIVTSGCGGSSKTTSPNILTRAEFITKADAICARIKAERDSITVRTTSDYARFMPSLGAYEHTAVAEMGRLTAPASIAGNWQHFIVDNRLVAEDTTKIGEDAKANKLHLIEPLAAVASQAYAQGTAEIRAYGFKNCIEPAS